VYANNTAEFNPHGIELYVSTNTGDTFGLMHTFPAAITGLDVAPTDPKTIWVSLRDGTVQRTLNADLGAAATWTSFTIQGAPTVSSRVFPTSIAVDPTNRDIAVVTFGGFTGLPQTGRTKHVFRTANGGTTWTDISGTDGGNAQTNVPDLPTLSVVIDDTTTPNGIIISNQAGVLRTLDNGATWQRLGVGLPTVYSSQLAIDRSANPTLLRVGTYGRSAFELKAETGPRLEVVSNLAFGVVTLGSSATLPFSLFNVGSADVHVSSITRTAGSTAFTIVSPTPPLTIPPGGQVDVTVRYAPTTAGIQTATFTVTSDDPVQPTRSVPASGDTPQQPATATPTATSTVTATSTRTPTATATATTTNTPTPTITPTSTATLAPPTPPTSGTPGVPCTTTLGAVCVGSGGVTGTWSLTGPGGTFSFTATGPSNAAVGVSPAFIFIPTTANPAGERFTCTAVGANLTVTCTGTTVGVPLQGATLTIDIPLTGGGFGVVTGIILGLPVPAPTPLPVNTPVQVFNPPNAPLLPPPPLQLPLGPPPPALPIGPGGFIPGPPGVLPPASSMTGAAPLVPPSYAPPETIVEPAIPTATPTPTPSTSSSSLPSGEQPPSGIVDTTGVAPPAGPQAPTQTTGAPGEQAQSTDSPAAVGEPPELAPQ
jgi:hypothetical protein